MKKRTLLQLREQYGMNLMDIAHAAHVRPLIVYAMLVGRPVSRQDAEMVLHGVTKLTGVTYCLEDVDVVLDG